MFSRVNAADKRAYPVLPRVDTVAYPLVSKLGGVVRLSYLVLGASFPFGCG